MTNWNYRKDTNTLEMISTWRVFMHFCISHRPPDCLGLQYGGLEMTQDRKNCPISFRCESFVLCCDLPSPSMRSPPWNRSCDHVLSRGYHSTSLLHWLSARRATCPFKRILLCFDRDNVLSHHSSEGELDCQCGQGEAFQASSASSLSPSPPTHLPILSSVTTFRTHISLLSIGLCWRDERCSLDRRFKDIDDATEFMSSRNLQCAIYVQKMNVLRRTIHFLAQVDVTLDFFQVEAIHFHDGSGNAGNLHHHTLSSCSIPFISRALFVKKTISSTRHKRLNCFPLILISSFQFNLLNHISR